MNALHDQGLWALTRKHGPYLDISVVGLSASDLKTGIDDAITGKLTAPFIAGAIIGATGAAALFVLIAAAKGLFK